MTKKYTSEQIKQVLHELGEVTYQHFGSYSYAAGVLESQLTNLLANAPRAEQAIVLTTIKGLTVKYSNQKETV